MTKISNLCPLCQQKTTKSLRGIKEYRFCSSCSLAWRINIPSINYDQTYYEGTSMVGQKLFSPLANFFYFLRSTFVLRKRYKRWIDVGAGDGSYLKTVPAKEKIGVEISSSGRKIMNQKSIKTLTDKQFLRSKNLNADIISFWHVLEHVDKPWEYLKTAEKNLKNSGKIIIGVPNHESLEFHVFGKYWFHLVPNFHLWHVSPKSVDLLLAQTNFKKERTDYWSLEHHLTGILQSFINKSANSDSVLHRLIKRGQNFSTLTAKDIFWCFFWGTVGLPIVIIFWFIGSVLKRPGTFIVIASKAKKK